MKLLSRILLVLLLAVLMCSKPPPAKAATDAETRRLFALTLYHEARQDGREGMTAVGWAALNRVKHPDYPKTLHAVLTQGGTRPPCQFGWRCDRIDDRPRDAQSWRLARQVAGQLLGPKPPPDPTGGAVFFWETWRQRPSWAAGDVEETTVIGTNRFFRLSP